MFIMNIENTTPIKQQLVQAKTQKEANSVYLKFIHQWNALEKENPHLSKFISITSTFHCLTISSVNLMIAKLKSKPGYENLHCYTCKDLENLTETLKKLKKSKFEGKIAFFVRSGQFRSMKDTAHHTTPVLIEKKADSFRIMVMDSTTLHNEVLPKGDASYEPIKKTIRNAELISLKEFYPMNVYMALNDASLPSAKVYLSTCARQKDHHTCPIFSLNDIKHFFNRDNFFEEIEIKGKIQQEKKDESLFYVYRLPPEHMKMTQSLTQIKEYLDSEADDKPWSKLKNKNWSLKTSVEKSTRNSSNSGNIKPINMKAADRHIKYFETIYTILKDKSPKELEEMSERFDSSHLKI